MQDSQLFSTAYRLPPTAYSFSACVRVAAGATYPGMPVLLIFVDGLGVGARGEHNPLARLAQHDLHPFKQPLSSFRKSRLSYTTFSRRVKTPVARKQMLDVGC